MRPELAKCLLDALGACRAIYEFTDGQTFDLYKQDLLLRSAVERQFEILGEAFDRIDGLDATFRNQLPEMGRSLVCAIGSSTVMMRSMIRSYGMRSSDMCRV